MNIESRIRNMNKTMKRSMIEWLKRTQKLKQTSMRNCAEHIQRYETEQRELEAKLAELSKKVETMNLQETCIKEFMDKAKTNIGMNDVTPKLLNLFVTRIEVSERESRNSGCAIKIRYTFQPECL